MSVFGPVRRVARGFLRRRGRHERGQRGWLVERLAEAHLEAWFAVIARRRGRPDEAERDRWRAVAAEAPGVGWTAGLVRRGSRIVGSILVDGERPPTIWDLWVDPRARGRGYGRALVGWGVEVGRARGEPSIEAHVRPGSDSWRLFREAGFRVGGSGTAVTPEHLVLRFEYLS